MTTYTSDTANTPAAEFDAVVVGAGFAGLHMLYRLRELGLSARVYEAGDDVGGTWYWNRYPGARCDIESMQYSYSFSTELFEEWEWTERYATQPEILRYLQHVADRFDLRRDIQFKTRVSTAAYDEAANRWAIRTDNGDQVSARYCIMATGCLSAPRTPDLPGLGTFRGEWYHTGNWPHEPVDFGGKRVGVVGTGSSGIQVIPVVADTAAHVYVFQRTANFSLPARNGPIDQHDVQEFKTEHDRIWERMRASSSGGYVDVNDTPALAVSPEEREREYERRWRYGGFAFTSSFGDLLKNKEANDTAAEFVRRKIRATVHDPAVAEALTPRDHPLGTKRICVDTNYFETYNRPHVTLVDVKRAPIVEVTPSGIRTADAEYDLDAIVFATGYDAMTGALLNIDIRGVGGEPLKEKWAHGPRAYLGLMAAGFPNLFMITGPGSPSVLSNMVVSIEQHSDWIAQCIAYMHAHDYTRVEPTLEAEDAWVQHVNDVADDTLYPLANSWWLGANIPGKPRVFMPYAGGVGTYRDICARVVANGYEGFTFGM